MIKIFATEKVKEIDKSTVEYQHIEPIDLVEEAVTAFVNEFRSQYTKARPVIVFAGQGNNGADALGNCSPVVGRILQSKGLFV